LSRALIPIVGPSGAPPLAAVLAHAIDAAIEDRTEGTVYPAGI
jgi:hypothetical protein